jgi:hypothetical protein
VIIWRNASAQIGVIIQAFIPGGVKDDITRWYRFLCVIDEGTDLTGERADLKETRVETRW